MAGYGRSGRVLATPHCGKKKIINPSAREFPNDVRGSADLWSHRNRQPNGDKVLPECCPHTPPGKSADPACGDDSWLLGYGSNDVYSTKWENESIPRVRVCGSYFKCTEGHTPSRWESWEHNRGDIMVAAAPVAHRMWFQPFYPFLSHASAQVVTCFELWTRDEEEKTKQNKKSHWTDLKMVSWQNISQVNGRGSFLQATEYGDHWGSNTSDNHDDYM